MDLSQKRMDATRSSSLPTHTRTGRPTKRTQAVMEAIALAIRDGASFELAAARGGITFQTFNEWRKQFSDFSEMVDAAIADCALWHLQNIQQHAGADWRASAWMLERRFPQTYGQRSVQEHAGEQTINITISRRSDRRDTNTKRLPTQESELASE